MFFVWIVGPRRGQLGGLGSVLDGVDGPTAPMGATTHVGAPSRTRFSVGRKDGYNRTTCGSRGCCSAVMVVVLGLGGGLSLGFGVNKKELKDNNDHITYSPSLLNHCYS